MIIFLSFTLIIKHRILLVAQFPSFYKRTQKRISKGVLLQCKRSPFGVQKESFWNAKGALFECKRTPSGMPLLKSGVFILVFLVLHRHCHSDARQLYTILSDSYIIVFTSSL